MSPYVSLIISVTVRESVLDFGSRGQPIFLDLTAEVGLDETFQKPFGFGFLTFTFKVPVSLNNHYGFLVKNKAVSFLFASVLSCWKTYLAGRAIFLTDEMRCRCQILTNATEARIFQFLAIIMKTD